MREALAHLASNGITEARRGACSFVVQLPTALGAYEVCFAREPKAARLAASRRSHDDVLSIDRVRPALRSKGRANVGDRSLHRLL
ncbi:hypothetical protein [Sphingomonas sp. GM_Shp_2]|uniref:hypothetical protein n=1 Tax=Sphingomonas sp. GM_Shp_2 TaxID=2937380 RepID=UPI00226A85E2|nr:hypothetical protein [Sphingomonas sp. GM_Shp_2]